MIKKQTWEDFRKHGLLLFINQFLHIFGWAICLEFDDNGKLIEAYPARVKYRGFNSQNISLAYENLSKYLKDNADILYDESKQ